MHFWGWAAPDESVTVTLDGQTAGSTADKLGRWSLYLPSHAAGGPFRVDVKGSNALAIDDVMIGDVWFASGQSNMEMPSEGISRECGNQEQRGRDSGAPISRSCGCCASGKRLLTIRSADYQDTWTTCTPQTAASFSAVAYFFGRAISDTQNVTVGLIDSTWGGTPAEAWTSFRGADLGLFSDARIFSVGTHDGCPGGHGFGAGGR